MQLSFVQKKNCRLIHKFLIKISNGITMHLTRALYQLYTDVRSKAAMRPKTKKRNEQEKKKKKKTTKMKHLIGSLSLKRDENQIERERKMTGVYIYMLYYYL